LSVQGVLTKADGTAVDDNTYSIEFSLWKSESSTALADKVYTEMLSVQTSGGVYNVILGLTQPLTPPFDQPYWLGVKFGSTELLPRPRLTSAPFALSLLGQNNTFPSTGTVRADAISIAGGLPNAGVAGRGYSFHGSGDQDGGMFSDADDKVSFFANNLEKFRISSGLNELFGNTNANNIFVYGTMRCDDGFGYHSGGNASRTGLYFDGSPNKASIYTDNNVRFHAWDDGSNYYRAPNSHKFDQGNVEITNNLTVGGDMLSNGRVRARGVTGAPLTSTGYTFNYPGNIDDSDSGLFGGGDGRVQIYANASLVAEFNPAFGTNTSNENSWGSTSVRLFGLQRGPDRRNVQWDEGTGRLYFDASSRRYKSNIQPLADDFSKILRVQPVTYDRPESQGEWEIGYIAEEIDSLGLTHLVEYSNGIPDGVNYEKMILYVTEVVKAQHADIENMKAEIAALKAEKAALQQENQTLRAESGALQSKQAEFGAQLDALAKRVKSLEGTAGNR
jgi:FtsZ-binding cell division protein ZapB